MQHNSEFTDSLVLGIDTGGTYTDRGVKGEYYSRRVLATHKSLTTKPVFDRYRESHRRDPHR